jgi:pimeloyl-ACP methyl ester carboxylesterase
MSATGLAGVTAGVPYVAHRPTLACDRTPLVIVLHLMDAPWNEVAMAAALPLAGVPAWRAYLGLPTAGARMPAGVEHAAQELPGAVAGLREQLSVARGPVVLVGASAGAAAVLLALAEGQVPVSAAVLITPAVRAAGGVDAGETPGRVADRLDFVSRAGDIASRLPQPGVLIVNGEHEDPVLLGPAKALYDALSARWWSPSQIEHVRIPELRHADRVVGPWLTRRLAG